MLQAHLCASDARWQRCRCLHHACTYSCAEAGLRRVPPSTTSERTCSTAQLSGLTRACRNARFCLICNHVNKIIPALQSRCTRFRFPPLPSEFVRTRLNEICQTEGIEVRCARPFSFRDIGSGGCTAELCCDVEVKLLPASAATGCMFRWLSDSAADASI